MRCPSHPNHELTLKKKVPPYDCSGCKQLGFYTRYQCPKCNFYLHQDCAHAANDHRASISLPFLPGCEFVFRELPFSESSDPSVRNPERTCDVCGLDIKGYNYHYYKEGLDLHPCCAKFKDRIFIEGGVELTLKNTLASKCNKCKKKTLKKTKNWGYVSDCGNYNLHISCANDHKLRNNWKSPVEANLIVTTRTEDLQMVVAPVVGVVERSRRRSGRGLKKVVTNVMKIVLSVVISVLVGDPTAIAVALITSLISS